MAAATWRMPGGRSLRVGEQGWRIVGRRVHELAAAGEVAGAVAVGLLRLAIGSKDSSSSEKYEVVADPQRYGERITANLAQTNAMLIARMVKER